MAVFRALFPNIQAVSVARPQATPAKKILVLGCWIMSDVHPGAGKGNHIILQPKNCMKTFEKENIYYKKVG